MSPCPVGEDSKALGNRLAYSELKGRASEGSALGLEGFALLLPPCRLSVALVPALKVTSTDCFIFSGQVCQDSRFGTGALGSVKTAKVKAVTGVDPPTPPPTAVGSVGSIGQVAHKVDN